MVGHTYPGDFNQTQEEGFYMGDMAVGFDQMKRERKARHRRWHAENRRLILEAGLEFIDKGETLLFRPVGRPMVDFYPSTGRWKYFEVMFNGGAKTFIPWYKEMLNGFRK